MVAYDATHQVNILKIWVYASSAYAQYCHNYIDPCAYYYGGFYFYQSRNSNQESSADQCLRRRNVTLVGSIVRLPIGVVP